MKKMLFFQKMLLVVLSLALALSPGFTAQAKTKINKDVRYCKERGMYGDNSVRNMDLTKKVTKEKAVIYLYNMYYDPLQSAIARGFVPYGERDTVVVDDEKGYYGITPVYDRQGTPYYWDKTRGRYVSKDGTYYPDNYNGSSGYRDAPAYSYRSRSTAWRWAVDIGIIANSDRPGKVASHRWYYNLVRHFAFYIDGRNSHIYGSKVGDVRKRDAARIMRAFCEDRLDVDDLEFYGTTPNNSNNNWWNFYYR